MRGYYISFGITTINILNKICMQMKEFENISEIEHVNLKRKESSIVSKIMYRIPNSKISLWDYESALKLIKNPDYIYIRRGIADYPYIDFLKKLHQQFPKCKILVEFFTYPYDKDEFSNWKMWWPYYIRECRYRHEYNHYVSKIVTYSNDKQIFGVNTIATVNGINVEQFPLKRGKKNRKYIHLIAVAIFQKQHGYERVIRGLGQYYNQCHDRKVVLHMVGDGPELKKYKRLCHKLKLDDVILFEGLQTGKKLDQLFDISDIALGAFGLYKNNVDVSSALKIREYLARGMPVVSGCHEDVLSNRNLPFFMEFPNDSSVIDIKEIINFYESNIEDNRSCTPECIREYAFKTVSAKVCMKPILDYLTI